MAEYLLLQLRVQAFLEQSANLVMVIYEQHPG